MARPRFSLRQLLKAVAIVAVLLGIARLCLYDPEVWAKLMPVAFTGALLAGKVLVVAALLVVGSGCERWFGSDNEKPRR